MHYLCKLQSLEKKTESGLCSLRWNENKGQGWWLLWRWRQIVEDDSRVVDKVGRIQEMSPGCQILSKFMSNKHIHLTSNLHRLMSNWMECANISIFSYMNRHKLTLTVDYVDLAKLGLKMIFHRKKYYYLLVHLAVIHLHHLLIMFLVSF